MDKWIVSEPAEETPGDAGRARNVLSDISAGGAEAINGEYI